MGLINYHPIKSNTFHRVTTNIQLIRQYNIVLTDYFLIYARRHLYALESFVIQNFTQYLIVLTHNQYKNFLRYKLCKHLLNQLQVRPWGCLINQCHILAYARFEIDPLHVIFAYMQQTQRNLVEKFQINQFLNSKWSWKFCLCIKQ